MHLYFQNNSRKTLRYILTHAIIKEFYANTETKTEANTEANSEANAEAKPENEEFCDNHTSQYHYIERKSTFQPNIYFHAKI